MKNYQDSLPPLEKKESFIQKNFNEIAPYYDVFNDLFTFRMHRNWKKKLLKLLQIDQAKEMIDLCCGSGDIAIYASKQNQNLNIVACDFSDNMLKTMYQRIQILEGKSRIKIEKQNVLQLPKEYSSSFDIATVGYGVRNVQDRIQFFKEVYRILKTTGRFGILEVGNIKPKFLQPIAYFYMKFIIPRIGWILHKERHPMYEYLPESAFVFPHPEEIVKELETVGFANVTYYRVFFGASILYLAYKKQ